LRYLYGTLDLRRHGLREICDYVTAERPENLQHTIGLKTTGDYSDIISKNTPTTEEPKSTAFFKMIELSGVEGKSYSYLTGHFPCKSEKGN
jgi:hypothetical protein